MEAPRREDSEYAIWLQQAFGAGSPKPGLLLRHFGGAKAVFDATASDYADIPGLSARDTAPLLRKSLAGAEAVAGECLRRGYQILAFSDAAFPARLREIYAPPCVLYVDGDLRALDPELPIAVVGTRQITDYGYTAATRLAIGLAQCGATVVSGLALGVDGAAHRGALKGDGKTVAVIGCGLDIPYPAPHVELKRLIAANGAVVSEFPPGTHPGRGTFPVRNRIIAGLSRGTLVVEAGEKSGALITAALAGEMGRDLFAVPGSIFSAMSAGPNRLIRDGAKPVSGVYDILEEYPQFMAHRISLTNTPQGGGAQPDEPQLSLFRPPDSSPAPRTARGTDKSAAPPEKKPEPARRPRPAALSETQAAVYNVLSASEEPVHVDTLALRANLELRVVLSVLTMLEIQGLVRSLPGRRYTAC